MARMGTNEKSAKSVACCARSEGVGGAGVVVRREQENDKKPRPDRVPFGSQMGPDPSREDVRREDVEREDL